MPDVNASSPLKFAPVVGEENKDEITAARPAVIGTEGLNSPIYAASTSKRSSHPGIQLAQSESKSKTDGTTRKTEAKTSQSQIVVPHKHISKSLNILTGTSAGLAWLKDTRSRNPFWKMPSKFAEKVFRAQMIKQMGEPRNLTPEKNRTDSQFVFAGGILAWDGSLSTFCRACAYH
ncbi:MAG: hypothetical protein ACRYF5_08125 [Janthinobacterium lividum]